MLRNLTRFVKDRVIYVPDPQGFELVTAPDVMLVQILRNGRTHGDCDDHVLLLNTLLTSIGFATVFIGVKQGGEDFNHVISGVDLNGQYLDIDPCDKTGMNVKYEEKYVVG